MFVTITHIGHPLLAPIKALYENAFPVEERREWQQLLHLLNQPAMKLAAIEFNNTFVGFIIWWQLGEWIYIEHLAIEPLQRGKSYGKQAMQQMIEIANGRLILETELPEDEIQKRRIRFYEKLGLQTLPVSYSQPPYRTNEQPIPMQLMTTNVVIKEGNYTRIIDLIRKEVYEKFYDLSL